MPVTTKNAVLWDVTPCGSLTTAVSEERSNFIIRMTIIGEPGASAATTTDESCEEIHRRRYVPPKLRFLQEPYGLTAQKTAFVSSIVLQLRLCYFSSPHIHAACTVHLIFKIITI
jgi:hypothetical protein